MKNKTLTSECCNECTEELNYSDCNQRFTNCCGQGGYLLWES